MGRYFVKPLTCDMAMFERCFEITELATLSRFLAGDGQPEIGTVCIRVLAPCSREFLRLRDLFGLDGRTTGFFIAK